MFYVIHNKQTIKLMELAVKKLNEKNILVEKWVYNEYSMEFMIFLKKDVKRELDGKTIYTMEDFLHDFPFGECISILEYDEISSFKDVIHRYDNIPTYSEPYLLLLLSDIINRIIKDNIGYFFSNNIYDIKNIEPKIDITYNKKHGCTDAFIKEIKISIGDSLTDYVMSEDKGSIFEIKDYKGIFYKLSSKLRYKEDIFGKYNKYIKDVK